MEQELIMFDVLLPAFNAQSTIRRTLDSINNQKYRPKKIVIIINGCKDQTMEIVDDFSFQTDITIKKIFYKKNVGLVNALNAGLNCCESEWVARIDADDYWLESHLENIRVSILGANKDLSLVAGTAIIKDGNRSIVSAGALNHFQLKRALIRDSPIVHSSVVYRLESVKSVGMYNHCSIFEDYHLWIRLLSKYSGHIIKSDMCVHERNEFSMTANIHRSYSINERFKNQLSAFMLFDMTDIKTIIYLILSFFRVVVSISRGSIYVSDNPKVDTSP